MLLQVAGATVGYEDGQAIIPVWVMDGSVIAFLQARPRPCFDATCRVQKISLEKTAHRSKAATDLISSRHV